MLEILHALLVTARGRAATAEGTARAQTASGYPAEGMVSLARAAAHRLAAEDVERALVEALRVGGRKELVTLPEQEG